jgi:sulfite reductase (ferredoxin)
MELNNQKWKILLKDQIPSDWAEEIDVYETQIELRKQGKMDEKIFAETRLRRGAYGQRYDNGHRHDGKILRKIPFPNTQTSKGPSTQWDAPGMQRIKFPFGGLTANQLEVLADLCEEYSDGIAHITTRQDFQLHFVHIEDTPDIMRRLAAVGITTREACGNAVRNVTACPIAGVCRTESFDVTPYAQAIFEFLLGHPDAQDFGRKFKISFSGCSQEGCGLAYMHDLGVVGVLKQINGKSIRGFDLYVGGGLGPVPYKAKLLASFVAPEELLPLTQAIARVFARLGEKKIRGMARVKFLVAKLGIDEFKRLVMEERKILEYDPRWTSLILQANYKPEEALKPPSTLKSSTYPTGFLEWKKNNTFQQPQYGYGVVYIKAPLGDLTAMQLRGLAQMVRKYTKGTIRVTVEQNIVLRWISEGDFTEVFLELQALGLAQCGVNQISDVTSCPGTDTCKLGISSSRGLARKLSQELYNQRETLDEEVKKLKIKISGCPNSCGQHHIADIGFYGVSRKFSGYTVPHFQLVLGGQMKENAATYGLAVGAVPSKRIPEALHRILDWYVTNRLKQETFQDFIKRMGKIEVKNRLQDLMIVPPHDSDKTLYSDWGDVREYTNSDIGKGECAGEIVTPAEFALSASEREVFEAQVRMDNRNFSEAATLAYLSMIHAAEACLRVFDREYQGSPEKTALEFKKRIIESGKFSGPAVAYFLRASESVGRVLSEEELHRRIQEAQLFLDAIHELYNVLSNPVGTI